MSPQVAAATAVTGRLTAPADLSLEYRTGDIDGAFTTHTGRAVPLRRSNVDTDQIIPAEYLKRVTRHRLRGRAVRRLADSDPDFVLNQPEYAGASILVAGPDFGTGSSREHAVWALQDYGFRAVICRPVRRHLPQQLDQGRAAPGACCPRPIVEALQDAVEADPEHAGHRRPAGRAGHGRRSGRCSPFADRRLHPLAAAGGARRHSLTLRHADDITRYEPAARPGSPWPAEGSARTLRRVPGRGAGPCPRAVPGRPGERWPASGR